LAYNLHNIQLLYKSTYNFLIHSANRQTNMGHSITSANHVAEARIYKSFSLVHRHSTDLYNNISWRNTLAKGWNKGHKSLRWI